MKGKCKNFCREQLEYESTTFSDGFVYYLPRNLDGTVHKCPFVRHLDDMDNYFENIIMCASESPETVLYDDIDANEAYGTCSENNLDWEIELDEIQINENKGISLTLESLNFTKNLISNWTSPFFMVNQMEIHENISPTDKGYQLEILGWRYQIIGNYDDAKKCYELQYKISKEPELSDTAHRLEEKINKLKKYLELKQSITENVSQDEIENIIKDTELKLRKYITTLYSDKFKQVWDRLPKVKEQILERQEEAEDSMVNIHEINELDYSTLGDLNKILRVSKPKKSHDTNYCNVCKKSWKRNQWVYYEKIPKEIFCKDKICFIKQGGLVKNIPSTLVSSVTRVKSTRNMLSHYKDYDKKMLQLEFNEIRFTCAIINEYINKIINMSNFV